MGNGQYRDSVADCANVWARLPDIEVCLNRLFPDASRRYEAETELLWVVDKQDIGKRKNMPRFYQRIPERHKKIWDHLR